MVRTLIIKVFSFVFVVAIGDRKTRRFEIRRRDRESYILYDNFEQFLNLVE